MLRSGENLTTLRNNGLIGETRAGGRSKCGVALPIQGIDGVSSEERVRPTCTPAVPEKPNVVLLAMRGGLGYTVLRALHAMGARIKIICDCRSSIRMSRYCRTLYVSKDLAAEPPERILQILEDEHRQTRVDLVLASDVVGTMLLNRMKGQLTPPVFPAADNATLGMLDNKWRFHQLCVSMGIPVPDSIFFESKERLNPALIESAIGYPAVVKPVQMMGGDGVIVVEGPKALATRVLSNESYACGSAGLIVQRYVAGQDWGFSSFSVEGRLEVAVAFACGPNWRTEFRKRPDLLDACTRIIQNVRYTGVLDFDCRLDPETGVFKFLECNPRFFRRVTAARLCGLNFVTAGVYGERLRPCEGCYFPIRDMFTWKGATSLLRRRWPISALAKDLVESISDPVPALVQNLGWAQWLARAASPMLQSVVARK